MTPEPPKVEQGHGVSKSHVPKLVHIKIYQGDYVALRSAYVEVGPTAVTPPTSAENGAQTVSTNRLAPKKQPS